MKGTKEMYDLMDMFEKTVCKLFYGHIVERYKKDEKVRAGEFYTDGFVNQMFVAFMSGYQFHKSISNMSQ